MLVSELITLSVFLLNPFFIAFVWLQVPRSRNDIAFGKSYSNNVMVATIAILPGLSLFTVNYIVDYVAYLLWSGRP